MSLAPSRRLGAYEVVALIGAGGMGEVYRARDTKLNRDVALKVLPEAFAFDPDRLARFKREAQVLASLNHTNIAAIYGFEESSGVQVLVLELVEGPTLGQDLYWKASTGAGNEEGVLKSGTPKRPTDWSHDGRFILYENDDPKSRTCPQTASAS
jgi:serine/threonine protein kinase